MRYILAVLLFATSAFSQEFRATLGGSVRDPTGSIVAGATVVATATTTGTKSSTISDSAGQYSIPFLAPGAYDVSVKATGFKEFVRKSLQLNSGDHAQVDIPLEIGAATQTVEVTADVSLVNTENASVGQSITTREVEDLPLNGRTPLVLSSLSTGVIATGQPSLIHPFDSGAASG